MIDKNFDKGCVFIVGGSGGIGSICAKEFAKAGANVVITYYKNKKAVIFGLPGAYTSVCSAKHL